MPFSRASLRRFLKLFASLFPISLILLELSEVCAEQACEARAAGDWNAFGLWDYRSIYCSTASDSLREVEDRATRNGGDTSAPH